LQEGHESEKQVSIGGVELEGTPEKVIEYVEVVRFGVEMML